MTDLEIAKQVCTPRELEALTLAERGMSERAIAHALDISRSSVRARLENAHRKLHRALKETNA
jgi:DNA-binding CsgD family transcriptional regulator